MPANQRPETFTVTFEHGGKTFEGQATVHSAGRGLFYATVSYGLRSKSTATYNSSGGHLRAECKMILAELVQASEQDTP